MAPRIPRPEYPRPTLVRPEWTNLNGRWKFEFDHGLSGLEEKWFEKHDYTREIVVPFCPESRLSGIGDRDWHAGVWYEREFAAPRLADRRLLLHFGASDYETTVFVGGREVGRHQGGYTPFTFDVTGFVKPGPNRLTVFAKDDLRSKVQPAGKQSPRLESFGCSYTRTTGIWQTGWAEVVPHVYVERVVATPSEDLERVRVEVDLAGSAQDVLSVWAYAMDGNEVVAAGMTHAIGGTRAFVDLAAFKGKVRRWSPKDPFLYTLRVRLFEKQRQADVVTSYFGMRTVRLTGRQFLLNDEPVYLKLILDQGFYPSGVYTAPTDAALRRDIEMSMAAGYNGARLHQKVFEPRFLWWADRMGYLCWGEAPDWVPMYDNFTAQNNLRSEWTEIVRRDVMHPAIVAWTATNEQHPTEGGRRRTDGPYLESLQKMIKQLDPTRPAIDNSGYWHTSTDVIDIHDYTTGDVIRKNWAKFRRTDRTSAVPAPHKPVMWPGYPVPSAPVVLSEVGGIGFITPGAKGWGYGGVPKTRGAFMKRFKDTMRAVMEIENACGFCYTQLTDVEQEINGIYTYDRKPKFDVRAIRKIHEEREE